MVLDCWVIREASRNFRISLIEPEIKIINNYNGTSHKYAYWGLNLLNTVQKDQFSFPFYKQGSEFYMFYLNTNVLPSVKSLDNIENITDCRYLWFTLEYEKVKSFFTSIGLPIKVLNQHYFASFPFFVYKEQNNLIATIRHPRKGESGKYRCYKPKKEMLAFDLPNSFPFSMAYYGSDTDRYFCNPKCFPEVTDESGPKLYLSFMINYNKLESFVNNLGLDMNIISPSFGRIQEQIISNDVNFVFGDSSNKHTLTVKDNSGKEVTLFLSSTNGFLDDQELTLKRFLTRLTTNSV